MNSVSSTPVYLNSPVNLVMITGVSSHETVVDVSIDVMGKAMFIARGTTDGPTRVVFLVKAPISVPIKFIIDSVVGDFEIHSVDVEAIDYKAWHTLSHKCEEDPGSFQQIWFN